MMANEQVICQINFYSGEIRLVRLGDDDEFVKSEGGRLESFEINDDEQLIGAELYEGDYNNMISDSFLGVTWLKCKK